MSAKLHMTTSQLKRWRRRRKLSVHAAGALLGVSGMTISRYERGATPIPKVVAMAIELLDEKEASK